MKSITIDNVVSAEHTHSKVWPQSADFGVYAQSLTVTVKTNKGYEKMVYILEDLRDYEEGYDPTLCWASAEECELYEEYKVAQRLLESREQGHSVRAVPGDTIEVYKGRKFPIGSRFVVKSEYTYYDRYDRAKGFYWLTEDGQLVPQNNCIIVKGVK